MALESRVDVLAAALDLKVVQLVRQAIRAADAQARPNGLPGPAPGAQPRPVIHPTPRFDPRPVIHPSPRFDPRPVLHPQSSIEQDRLACDRCLNGNEVVVYKSPTEQPLQLPWKSAPWENRTPPAPKIKLARPHPDIIHKGTLLDFFI